MSLLDSFIHGEDLTEIFIEGHNPYALRKLYTADVDELRQQVKSSEAIQAYVTGRMVGAGRGVWLLTDQAVILRNAMHKGVERIEINEVESFEAVRGRYGHTVRLRAAGRAWSLFGVAGELAGVWDGVLKARGYASDCDPRPAQSPFWRDAAPGGWVQECLSDARQRLNLA